MQKPFLIGITGGSGSGKTTFIRQLRDGLNDDQVCYLSMDDYYVPREQQKVDDEGVHNFDRPKSIYRDEFVRDLKKLCKGKTVTRQEYVFNNELAEPRMLVFKPAPVIIVEGLFVFHYKELRKMLDLRIFLHAKDNLKVVRRIKRDRVERNYPLEDVLYRYEHHVLPAFEKYVEPYKEKADIIVNNNTDFNMGLQVVRAFVEGKV
ncbi:uridine kinase family protein [Neolewinella agarilytica]|uniref:Uridine kinase n=1 Tax=Neolewinella agarilytica TaxID=478744 RepID=A0A1H8Z3Q1_9BACT|nr:AAA family ATPase [Neolewinella agarilytica]SEP59016.1 uridine kinase [Neolewinella agarilytica]